MVLKSNQNNRLNWSIFFSGIYTLALLPIINIVCISLGFWDFNDDKSILRMPFDVYFCWVILWSFLPLQIFKGKYILPISIVLTGIDLLTMKALGEINLLRLNKTWIIGELLMIALVFLPGYYWAYCFYYKKNANYRASLQVIVIIVLFVFIVPSLLVEYNVIEKLNFRNTPFIFQLLFIVALPSLIAVIDLVRIGNGTPFPFDKTNHLVTTGVYAYIRNPIQWSFTIMFIPLSLYYQTPFLLLGSLVSYLYCIGVSDFQENEDMGNRFKEEWDSYKASTPKWRFLWKPINTPSATIYFDMECEQCSQIRIWLQSQSPINLTFESRKNFPQGEISQVTLVQNNGIKIHSIEAIAFGLERINLLYASASWFIRLPLIKHLLQAIVDSLGINSDEEKCNI